MTAAIFDGRGCELGEGPLWHPIREQLFWFDITGRRLLTRKRGEAQEWHFADMVSAAGWTGPDGLLVASDRALFHLDLATGLRSDVAALEAGNPATRSNDGRADPQGGFWIGTMGKGAEHGAGAIYRWYRGTLRRLFDGISIPNAISFPPGGQSACFTDTATGRVLRVALDAAGWPRGEPETFLDLAPEGINPDGAVFDAEGRFWLAEWGGARVSCHAPDGARLFSLPMPVPHVTCPAFGGRDLFVTSARQGMSPQALARIPDAGATFRLADVAQGQPEHMVIL